MNIFKMAEEDTVFLMGIIEELDPTHESEAWRFATENVLPTCIVEEDADLAYVMITELDLMVSFLQQLSRL